MFSINWVSCVNHNGNQYFNGLLWQVTAVTSGAKIAGDYCGSGNKTGRPETADWKSPPTSPANHGAPTASKGD
jgi:hypothetical protein